MPELTRVDGGALNLATMLNPCLNPSDLGPKCYFALGQVKEHAIGDSITKLHMDMADAVNVMLHQQRPASMSSPEPRRNTPWQPPEYQVSMCICAQCPCSSLHGFSQRAMRFKACFVPGIS
jgi:hypothetical protein